MALAKRNYTYVDFVKEPYAACFNKTGPVATAGNTQQDWFVCPNSKAYFEYIQTGQNDVIYFLKQTDGSFRFPLDNTDGDGVELTEGILTAGQTEFVVGTDAAFFVQAVFKVTTVADIDVLQVGFRKQGAYVAVTTPASALAAYDDKATIGIYDNAGAFRTQTSDDGSDTATNLAKAALTDGQYVALKVLVSAAGAVTYRIGVGASAAAAVSDLAADANAVAASIDSAEVLVPTIQVVATGNSAPEVDLYTYECGYQV